MGMTNASFRFGTFFRQCEVEYSEQHILSRILFNLCRTGVLNVEIFSVHPLEQLVHISVDISATNVNSAMVQLLEYIAHG